MNRWERALEGEGQVALIVGEAGIGKSRLVQRFREQIAGTPHTWVEAAAGAFFQNTPFYAVTEMLRELLAWRGDESAEEQLAQLETRLELAGLKPAEALPLIAPLLESAATGEVSAVTAFTRAAAPPPAGHAGRVGAGRRPSAADSDRDRRLALGRPLDPGADSNCWSSRGRRRGCCCCTRRAPSFAPHGRRGRITRKSRSTGLSSRNVRTMVGQVAAQKALSDETVATVVERTGGVPLFVEELTRAVLESGDAKLTRREIPVTLHDSLMARLDRLGPAKEVAQIGCSHRREFSYELLHAVHPIAGRRIADCAQGGPTPN